MLMVLTTMENGSMVTKKDMERNSTEVVLNTRVNTQMEKGMELVPS